MLVKQSGTLKYLSFESFPDDNLFNGIFTRHGGVSPESFSSLNVSGMAGDSRGNVIENRSRILKVFNQPLDTIYDVWQIHSGNVVFTNSPRGLENKHTQADAIFTNSKDVTLFMQFADCVPILIYDPEHNIIGIIHAGWQGTVKRIVQNSIQFLSDQFSTDPQKIIAGIGPSIGPDHYEVGTDVILEVENKLHEIQSNVIKNVNGRSYFDLWETNKLLLNQMGVNNIELAEICTACNLNDWYSYRLEGTKSGRFGVVFGFKKGKNEL